MNFSKIMTRGDLDQHARNKQNEQLKEEVNRPLSSEQKKILQLEGQVQELEARIADRDERRENKKTIDELKLKVAELQTELKNAN